MEPKHPSVRKAPPPWQSLDVAFDAIYKLLIPGLLIVGLIIFILATTNNLQGQPIMFCQGIGILLMAFSGVCVYLLIMNKASPKDNWMLTFPPEPEDYYKVLGCVTDYLKKKGHTFGNNPDLADNPIKDRKTKELLMEELIITGKDPSGLKVRIIIRDTKKPRYGFLEIREIQNNNLAQATVMAIDQVKVLEQVGVEYYEE